MQPLGLVLIVEEDAVLAHALDAEIVADAADRDHQRVVGDAAGADDLAARLVDERRQVQQALRPVDARHAPLREAEAVRAGLAQIDDRVVARVERARGDLVQQRLPEVGEVGIDQRDDRPLPAAEALAQPRRQHEPAGASADDDDPMRLAHMPVPRSGPGPCLSVPTRPSAAARRSPRRWPDPDPPCPA